MTAVTPDKFKGFCHAQLADIFHLTVIAQYTILYLYSYSSLKSR